MTCPSFDELSVAWSARERPAHLDGCAACRDVWRDLEQLREAGKALPWTDADERARASGEAALLEAALLDHHARSLESARLRRVGWAAAAAAMVLVGSAAWITARGARSQPEPEPADLVVHTPRRATVRDAQGARFEHRTTAETARHDEVLQLNDGHIALDVEPLTADQRFRVVTADAEIELRGTSLSVEVADRELTRVSVISGRAELRLPGGEVRTLGPGEVWTRREQPSAEALYAQGFEALRAGDLGRAEQDLAELVRAHPAAELREEATYWRAVVAARGARPDDARSHLEALLSRYPGSPRAAEASAMLGWLELERGEVERARALFAAAQGSGDPAVEESARAGLAKLP
jgi:TolA-binding protein